MSSKSNHIDPISSVDELEYHLDQPPEVESMPPTPPPSPNTEQLSMMLLSPTSSDALQSLPPTPPPSLIEKPQTKQPLRKMTITIIPWTERLSIKLPVFMMPYITLNPRKSGVTDANKENSPPPEDTIRNSPQAQPPKPPNDSAAATAATPTCLRDLVRLQRQLRPQPHHVFNENNSPRVIVERLYDFESPITINDGHVLGDFLVPRSQTESNAPDVPNSSPTSLLSYSPSAPVTLTLEPNSETPQAATATASDQRNNDNVPSMSLAVFGKQLISVSALPAGVRFNNFTVSRMPAATAVSPTIIPSTSQNMAATHNNIIYNRIVPSVTELTNPFSDLSNTAYVIDENALQDEIIVEGMHKHVCQWTPEELTETALQIANANIVDDALEHNDENNSNTNGE